MSLYHDEADRGNRLSGSERTRTRTSENGTSEIELGLFTVSLATSDPAFDLDQKLNRTFEFSSQELDHLVTTLIEEVQHRGLFTDGFERYPTTVAELGLLQKSVKEFVGNETFASVVKIDKLRMCVTEIRTLLSRVNSARRYPIPSFPQADEWRVIRDTVWCQSWTGYSWALDRLPTTTRTDEDFRLAQVEINEALWNKWRGKRIWISDRKKVYKAMTDFADRHCSFERLVEAMEDLPKLDRHFTGEIDELVVKMIMDVERQVLLPSNDGYRKYHATVVGLELMQSAIDEALHHPELALDLADLERLVVQVEMVANRVEENNSYRIRYLPNSQFESERYAKEMRSLELMKSAVAEFVDNTKYWVYLDRVERCISDFGILTEKLDFPTDKFWATFCDTIWSQSWTGYTFARNQLSITPNEHSYLGAAEMRIDEQHWKRFEKEASYQRSRRAVYTKLIEVHDHKATLNDAAKAMNDLSRERKEFEAAALLDQDPWRSLSLSHVHVPVSRRPLPSLR
ncbi:hypothetical protein JCM16303_006554 [Sporobolomyces ruberrimus]